MVDSTIRRSSRPRSLSRGVARAVRGGLARRLTFPTDHLGRTVEEGGRACEVYLETRYTPRGPAREPQAELVIHYRRRTDRGGAREVHARDRTAAYALTPVLLRLEGFRSTVWALDRETGTFVARCAFDTGADAHAAVAVLRRLLDRVAVPESVSIHVRGRSGPA